jgi:hypothetical protein
VELGRLEFEVHPFMALEQQLVRFSTCCADATTCLHSDVDSAS